MLSLFDEFSIAECCSPKRCPDNKKSGDTSRVGIKKYSQFDFGPPRNDADCLLRSGIQSVQMKPRGLCPEIPTVRENNHRFDTSHRNENSASAQGDSSIPAFQPSTHRSIGPPTCFPTGFPTAPRKSTASLSPSTERRGGTVKNEPASTLQEPQTTEVHPVAVAIAHDAAAAAEVAAFIAVYDGPSLPGFEAVRGWTPRQQAALREALQLIPIRAGSSDLGAAFRERMERVSRCVPGKTAAECTRAALALAAARPGQPEAYFVSAHYR